MVDLRHLKGSAHFRRHPIASEKRNVKSTVDESPEHWLSGSASTTCEGDFPNQYHSLIVQ